MSIPWYGELPERWESKRVGTLFYENTTSNVNLQSEIPMQFRFGEIIRKRAIEKDEGFLDSIRRYTIIQTNDIMVNGLNLNYDFITQRVAIVREKGCMTPAYISIRPKNLINPHFACYLLKAMDGQKILNGLGTGIRLTLGFSELKKTYIPLPPRDEQDQIVRYLDWKVSQMNKLINAKKRQITLLHEQKRTLINKEVTRYGNDWQKRPLKTIGRITYGLGEPPELTPNGIPIIRATNIERGKIVPNDLLRTLLENIPSGKDVVLVEGNIIVVRSGAYAGDVGYITSEWSGALAGYDMLLRVKLGEPRFIMYALLSEYVLKDQWYLRRIRSAQPHLNAEDIGSSYIFYPTVQEQKTIAKYLDERCGLIEKIIAKIDTELALLAEYRTRLISDVVTGKMDVRCVVVPEYEAVEATADEIPADADEPEETEE